MKVGIFGGTFDPVHNAHLALARAALKYLRLGRLIWMPTGRPGYREQPVASPRHRVAMLELATADESRYSIDQRELAANATGYTVDTLRSLKKELRDLQALYLVIGADQLAKFESWREPDAVRGLAQLAVFHRPGFKITDPDVIVVPMKRLAISASDVRARVGRGEDVSALVPVPVANYIRDHRLYT